MADPEKYINPDPRCTYPSSGMDYCWSYANLIDLEPDCTDTAEICKDCEYWDSTAKKVLTFPER